MDFGNARTMLINITTSSSLKLREVLEIMECIQDAAMDAAVVVAAIIDESMGDDLRLTLFATGLILPFGITANDHK